MTQTPTFTYHVTSDTMANYFDVFDDKVKENKKTEFWELIDKDDTNYYLLDCYSEQGHETSYHLYWRINAEQSDIGEAFDYKPYCEWTKISYINTSSGFAMASCGWECEDIEDDEDDDE
jgi:hypothetical protein